MAKEGLNIVFAVDHSGSMSKQDGQQMVSRMLKEFIDTLDDENVNVGYVAYNDSILAQCAPVPVQETEQKSMLNETIDQVQSSGETDIGLGFACAYHLMDECTGRKMVVLISDGETDLTYSDTDRTKEDSDQDIQDIVWLCQKEGTPVVTIALGTQSEGEEGVLQNIADQTAGRSYSAQTSDELMGIFYNLLFLVEQHNLTASVEWSGEICKNKELEFEITFTDAKGGRAESINGFGNAVWYAAFEDEQKRGRIPVKLEWKDGKLTGKVTFDHAGNYGLTVENKEYAGFCYEISDIAISNTLPGSLISKTIELSAKAEEREWPGKIKETQIDLDACFADADGDVLTYQLQSVPEDIVSARIEGNKLYLTPGKNGNGEITLLVSDGDGSLYGQIPVRVKPSVQIWWVLLLFVILIAGLIFYRLQKRKKKTFLPPQAEEKQGGSFSGKLNAYFTLLPDQNEEIPPLTFALHPIREKKIVLGNMFGDYPDLVDLLDLDNIYLVPAENRKLVLFHNSSAGIMIGNSIICRKMQYVISDGNVIYITSCDGSCELEVHYITKI